MGSGPGLGKHRNHAAQKIEDQVAAMPHTVFDVVPENPEHPHIRQEMNQTAVQEHGGKQRPKATQVKDVVGLHGQVTGRNKPIVRQETPAGVA